MNFRVGNSTNNIFANSDSSLSRVRSASGSASESEMRSLSRKDTLGSVDTIKDELEYQFTNGMQDQQDAWSEDDYNSLFDD